MDERNERNEKSNVTILEREDESQYSEYHDRYNHDRIVSISKYEAGERITIESALNSQFFDGTFEDNSKAPSTFEAIVTYLLNLKDDAGNPPSVEERNAIIDNVTNEYIMQTRKTPNGAQIQRLGNWIMFETLTDSHPDKVTNTEFPVLTNRQLRTRYQRESANDLIEKTESPLRYLKGTKSTMHNNNDNY